MRSQRAKRQTRLRASRRRRAKSDYDVLLMLLTSPWKAPLRRGPDFLHVALKPRAILQLLAVPPTLLRREYYAHARSQPTEKLAILVGRRQRRGARSGPPSGRASTRR